ncbi:FAD-dependent monooxygenase [Streptomyces fagopyri]|uniref:FAD-dependent monooxygenase n=1 Tax=Streptomyces fagopyri TaxID=2662397 RepID=UPI00369888B1
MRVLQVPQTRVEQVLEERARELGVEIRRGHGLTTLRQDDDAVSLDIRGPEGAYWMRTRYLDPRPDGPDASGRGHHRHA